MYSKYDDPDYVPAPGERERDRLRWLAAQRSALLKELARVDEEIEELRAKSFVLDTPFPH